MIALKFTLLLETDEADSPHPVVHKTESVTNLPDEVETAVSKQSAEEKQLGNASSDPERSKLSHMKVPAKVDSAPVQTKQKKSLSPHPTESECVRTRQSPTNVSACLR